MANTGPLSESKTIPKTILVVDDEAPIRILVERALGDLADQGVTILSARNGVEAVEVIQNHKPDLVFLDVMMPKMDGFEVCEIIKHKFRFQNTCVILLTAKGQDIDHKRGKQVGADLYCVKPFEPHELLRQAAQVLGIDLTL